MVMSSRSLQNFYSCRFLGVESDAEVPVLYKISTLVDRASVVGRLAVPVLYKISTLVDMRTCSGMVMFPFFTKFLLL